jgi:arylsulfatase A-like enzyme
MTQIAVQWAIRAVFTLALIGLAPHLAAEQAKDSPPNILIISIDDLNDWVGCMGGHPQAKTPNIDRLAQRGILFTNAHCQAPICGPSRTSLWTGYYPHQTGVYGQIRSKNLAKHPAIKDNPDRYISTYFKKHGYKTMAVGKLFHGDAGVDAFDTYGGKLGVFGPKPKKRFNYNHPPQHSTQTDWGAYPDRDEDMPDHKVADWAVDQLAKAHDKPLFLAVGFWRPHVPFYVPQKWFDMFPLEEIVEPEIKDDDLDDIPPISKRVHAVPMMPQLDWMREQDQIDDATQAYLACVAFVDHQVGRVLDALEQSTIADNTIVVLWSDHGYHLGEKHRWAKHGLWEEATKVPLIFAGPGITGNNASSASVGLIDLYPTLTDLAGLPVNENNQGMSLTPLMDPESDVGWDRPILTTYSYGNHALRDARYRYIRYEDSSEELYDHRNDPNEWTNLANNPGQASTLERFRALLPTEQSAWHPDSRGPKTEYHDENKARHSDN